jgi:hypothetical protein
MPLLACGSSYCGRGGPALIVACEEVVENGLQLLDRLEQHAVTLDVEVPINLAILRQSCVAAGKPLR